MLEKTVHFLNVDFAEYISMQEYPKISEVAVRTCTTSTTNLAKLTEMHLHRSLFSTCNLQLHRKGDVDIYVDFCKNFQEHVCYRKPPANWFWFRILLKMENRHSHYDKDISRSRPLFQKTDIAREKVYLRTIDRMLTLNFNYQLFRRYFMPKVCY